MDALDYFYDEDFRDEMRADAMRGYYDDDEDDHRLPAYIRGGMTVSTRD